MRVHDIERTDDDGEVSIMEHRLRRRSEVIPQGLSVVDDQLEVGAQTTDPVIGALMTAMVGTETRTLVASEGELLKCEFPADMGKRFRSALRAAKLPVEIVDAITGEGLPKMLDDACRSDWNDYVSMWLQSAEDPAAAQAARTPIDHLLVAGSKLQRALEVSQALPCTQGEEQARCVLLTETVRVDGEDAERMVKALNERASRSRSGATMSYSKIRFDTRKTLLVEAETFLPHRLEVTGALEITGVAEGKPREHKTRSEHTTTFTYEKR